ncbi:MAG TPA: low specificity L-threonine aldolase [Cyclobacteriaceae bacterium]|nr:low specificity L-threonine aldolase [Cyclobacteriaceae bacterium]
MSGVKSFASDNYAGAHPEVLQAVVRANEAHTVSYGDDPYTASAIARFKKIFGDDIEVFFVYNGTGANVLGLSALTRSFNAIICSDCAHINVDESTAPEKFTGCKLVTIPSLDGKITARQVHDRIQRLGDQHHPQFKAISISQSTEFGTVYTVDEIKALSAVAKEKSLYFHMDGARIANAAVSQGKDLRSITRDAGIDVLSFGGTKNGLMFGEAVIFFKPELAKEVRFLRKQAMQLNSKMRFISVQFDALLDNDLWKRNATHSNAMAKKIENELKKISAVKITQSVDANGIFVEMPANIIPALQKEYPFYVWNEKTHEARLMCSWDTTEEDVAGFVRELRKLVGGER